MLALIRKIPWFEVALIVGLTAALIVHSAAPADSSPADEQDLLLLQLEVPTHSSAYGMGIQVNAADPTVTTIDLNGYQGRQRVEEGAAEVVRLALLPPDGPTGGFSQTAGPNPW
jgi:hypothetical protein